MSEEERSVEYGEKEGTGNAVGNGTVFVNADAADKGSAADNEKTVETESAARASCAENGDGINAAESASVAERKQEPVASACEHARHRYHVPDAAEIRKLIKKYHIAEFFKSNTVLLIAIAAALITSIFVPFDAQYADYFDWRTLTCLFCTLAVVAAFKNIKFFVWLADRIVRRFKSLRTVIASLVFVTYFGSMIMANDMALVTFLPLGYFVLDSCGDRKHLAFTFIMQNIAANLGGMLTPFGNPQNLYMYSYFNIGAGEFFKIMALPFAAAFALIAVVCFIVKKEKVVVTTAEKKTPPVRRMAVYGVMFVFSVLIVFRIFPYYWGLLAVFVAVCALDYRALFKVDYGLLLTFCAFFVFSGNMARIEAVNSFFAYLMDKDPLIFGVLCCQVISNVPSAVLLSRFTTAYPALLVAVNLGGLGTPIASLASLITLNTYRKLMPGETKKYLLKFLLINFGFLAVLIGVGYLNPLILALG